MAFVPMDSDKLNSLLPFTNEECSSETLSPDVSKEFDETFQFKNEVSSKYDQVASIFSADFQNRARHGLFRAKLAG